MNTSPLAKLLATALIVICAVPSVAKPKFKSKQTSEQIRAEYLQRLQENSVMQPEPATVGSIWSPNAPLAQIGSDVKARTINDTVTIRVAVNTTSQAAGTVNTQRTFQTQSAITGLAGHVSTGGVNPILDANSSTQLKGTGQTASNSNLQTNLSGQVIAVLGNGNLVLEAQRQIFMNDQKETVVVRGVARPTDIDTYNSIASGALNNLEIELRGKGVISDSTRQPNPLTRFLLRIIGF
jgi:flagellar L-ring protein FlgH